MNSYFEQSAGGFYGSHHHHQGTGASQHHTDPSAAAAAAAAYRGFPLGLGIGSPYASSQHHHHHHHALHPGPTGSNGRPLPQDSPYDASCKLYSATPDPIAQQQQQQQSQNSSGYGSATGPNSTGGSTGSSGNAGNAVNANNPQTKQECKQAQQQQQEAVQAAATAAVAHQNGYAAVMAAAAVKDVWQSAAVAAAAGQGAGAAGGVVRPSACTPEGRAAAVSGYSGLESAAASPGNNGGSRSLASSWNTCSLNTASQPVATQLHQQPANHTFYPWMAIADKCTINIGRLEYNHALMIKYGIDDGVEFVYPQNVGKLIINTNDNLTLSCPGKDNYISIFKDSKLSEETFQCKENLEFIHSPTGSIYSFMDFTCASLPVFDVREIEHYHSSTYSKFDIGFPVSKGFLVTIEVFFHKYFRRTQYVKQLVPYAILGKERTAKSSSFDPKPLDPKIKEFYKPEYQIEMLKKQLLCANLDEKDNNSCINDYINLDVKLQLYFSRSHLAPKSHFVYQRASASTFFFINTGLQYSKINCNNWARIEDFVTDLITNKKSNLVVYTGTWGILRLPDKAANNTEKKIYLDMKDDVKGVSPAPLYFWKIIYEPERKLGVVFVTHNDPITKKEHRKICKDAYMSFSNAKMPRRWKPWAHDWGFSYMCEVNDFLNTTGVQIADQIIVNDILIIEKDV